MQRFDQSELKSAGRVLLMVSAWVLFPGVLMAQDSGGYGSHQSAGSVKGAASGAISDMNYGLRIKAGADVPISPAQSPENSAVQTLAEIQSIRAQLTVSEDQLKEALKAKQEKEEEYKKLDEMLHEKVTGMLWQDDAGKPEEMAFPRQVMMTLDLISDELRRGLSSGDLHITEASIKRFASYRDLGDPAEARKQLSKMIEQAGERQAKLPSMIQEAERQLAVRSQEQEAAVQKTLAEFAGLLQVEELSETRSDFMEHAWPEYKNYTDVLLPWKRLIHVDIRTLKVTAAGMPMSVEFRNGEMDPAVLGTLMSLKAAQKEYPGHEIRMVRKPEVLSTFGGYSVVRDGFVHFLSVIKDEEPAEFLLFETLYSGHGVSQPAKAASFSIYDITPQLLSAADVNQDGELNGLDTDLIVTEIVTKNSREQGTVTLPDINSDGTVSQEDALVVLAVVESGAGAVERSRQLQFIETVFKAQNDFLRGIPGIWREVRGLEPVMSREELEHRLRFAPEEERAYLLSLHDYFTLMKTAAEAIETLNPDLISLRHPDFFDEEGNLLERLVRLIEESGLAALPEVAIFDAIDTRIPRDDLYRLGEDMRSILGDVPELTYEMKLSESRMAMFSVQESLHAVNEAIMTFLNSLPEEAGQ